MIKTELSLIARIAREITMSRKSSHENPMAKKSGSRLSPTEALFLWCRAGGCCTKCKMPLFRKNRGKICKIGEQAHIISRKKEGPRGGETRLGIDLDSEENVILLCGNCHHEIDVDPEYFDVQSLLDMKRQHEQETQPTTRHESQGSWTVIGSPLGEGASGFGALFALYSEKGQITITIHGEAEEIGHMKWKGGETQFSHWNPEMEKPSEFMTVSPLSEVDFGIEKGSFYILVYTMSWKHPDTIVPFAKITYEFLPLVEHVEIVYAPYWKREDLSKLRRILDDPSIDPVRKEEALDGIRDIGVADPILAANLLKECQGQSWCSGEVAEIASYIEQEISWIVKAKS